MKVEHKVTVNLSGKEAWVLSDFYDILCDGIFSDMDSEDIWGFLENLNYNFRNRENTYEVPERDGHYPAYTVKISEEEKG